MITISEADSVQQLAECMMDVSENSHHDRAFKYKNEAWKKTFLMEIQRIATVFTEFNESYEDEDKALTEIVSYLSDLYEKRRNQVDSALFVACQSSLSAVEFSRLYRNLKNIR